MSGSTYTNKADPCKIKDKIPDANPVKIYFVTRSLIIIGNKLSASVPFVENYRKIYQSMVKFSGEKMLM